MGAKALGGGWCERVPESNSELHILFYESHMQRAKIPLFHLAQENTNITTSMALKFDPEFEQAIAPLMGVMANIQKPPANDVATRRSNLDALFGPLVAQAPDFPDVEETVYKIKSHDSAELSLHHFKKQGTPSSDQPAIVYFHGGGMIALSMDTYRKMIKLHASLTGIQYFAVEYRLAPEYPDPTPVEDCYAALAWVSQNAGQYGVDPARLAVQGDSAGGGLAAGVSLLARDRALSPPLAKSILVYPMLDHKNLTINPAIDPFLMWDVNDNITGWTALLGDKAGKDGVSQYASPLYAETVAGLPATYIDCGELDLFRDEDFAYATRLAKANVSCEFHMYPGVPHAFEVMASTIAVSQTAIANRFRAIKSF